MSLAFGAMFLVSGVAKLRAGDFRLRLSDYQLLPSPVVGPSAVGLPLGEVVLGISLLLGVMPRQGLAASSVLLLIFSAAMIVNLLRGRRINCGCRGNGAAISWRLVAINSCLAAAAVGVAAHETAPPPALPTLLSGAPSLAQSDAFAVLVSVTVTALMARLIQAWARADRAVEVATRAGPVEAVSA